VPRVTVVALPGAAAPAAPCLVADPAGGAIAGWADGSDVAVGSIRRAEGGAVGRLRRAAGATLVDVAASGGRATAVWTGPDGAVEAATYRPADGWTADGPIGARRERDDAPGGPRPRRRDRRRRGRSPRPRSPGPPGPRGAAGRPDPDLTPAGHGASGLSGSCPAAAPEGPVPDEKPLQERKPTRGLEPRTPSLRALLMGFAGPRSSWLLPANWANWIPPAPGFFRLVSVACVGHLWATRGDRGHRAEQNGVALATSERQLTEGSPERVATGGILHRCPFFR
jgi:hypothetical protein